MSRETFTKRTHHLLEKKRHIEDIGSIQTNEILVSDSPTWTPDNRFLPHKNDTDEVFIIVIKNPEFESLNATCLWSLTELRHVNADGVVGYSKPIPKSLVFITSSRENYEAKPDSLAGSRVIR